VMMNDPKVPAGRRRCSRAFAEAGARVAVVTAKDKLRKLLGHGLKLGPHLRRQRRLGSASRRRRRPRRRSSRTASRTWSSSSGMPVPSVYSAELSEFVFAAGVKLLETRRPGPHVPLDHRLRAAQVRARKRGRERLLRDDGPLPRPSWTRSAPSSRSPPTTDERQDARRRLAQRDLPAGRARRLDRQRTRRA
jgi:hypothetical protein